MAEEKGILRGMFSDGPKACAHFNEGLSKGEEKRGEFSLKRKVESGTSEERQKERQQEATCITMEAVDRLIDEAREEAAKAQGSSLGPTPEDSHQHESFNSDTFEGSVQETENGSQWFHQKIQGLFERHLGKRGSFCTVSDIGPLVDDALKLLIELEAGSAWWGTLGTLG